jgi:7-cyano-7-deazaguanosine (preQ0) biosynthesis protein QueE
MRRVGLRVAEMFGPTFQGEGPSCGQLAAFVRLAGCPLACSWCDTPYTWDRTRFDLDSQSRWMTVNDVFAGLAKLSPELVVITGGEPLLQQRQLIPLVRMLIDAGRRVEIETSGTIEPIPALARSAAFNVSPKLGNAGMPYRRRINPAALTAFQASGTSCFKFVVRERNDLTEVDELQVRFDLTPVWIMPEGTAPAHVLATMRELADEVLARGWHLSNRLHILLWGDARGR